MVSGKLIKRASRTLYRTFLFGMSHPKVAPDGVLTVRWIPDIYLSLFEPSWFVQVDSRVMYSHDWRVKVPVPMNARVLGSTVLISGNVFASDPITCLYKNIRETFKSPPN